MSKKKIAVADEQGSFAPGLYISESPRLGHRFIAACVHHVTRYQMEGRSLLIFNYAQEHWAFDRNVALEETDQHWSLFQDLIPGLASVNNTYHPVRPRLSIDFENVGKLGVIPLYTVKSIMVRADLWPDWCDREREFALMVGTLGEWFTKQHEDWPPREECYARVRQASLAAHGIWADPVPVVKGEDDE